MFLSLKLRIFYFNNFRESKNRSFFSKKVLFFTDIFITFVMSRGRKAVMSRHQPGEGG